MANLILPRVRVTWGDINLSAYNGSGRFPKGEPLVFDTEVQMQSETSAPTGSFKWNPSGPAYEVYESFISSEEYMKTRIVVEYFYPRGKRVRFAFVWAGQSISYGNDMSVTVKLKTELDGQVNANIRSTAQAYEEKKGTTFLNAIEKSREQFGIKNESIVRYENKAKDSLQKATLENAYGTDQTFAANVANIAKQNGNTVFANNIGEPNVIIFAPFSWKPDNNEVLDGAKDFSGGTDPDPSKRYGYLLGPSIINSMVRDTEWKPPQQTNTTTPSTQPQARDSRGRFIKSTPPTAPQNKTSETGDKTSSPVGVANGRANPGIKNLNNPDGPDKQNAIQDENSAQLSLHTLMVPLLVGIKPYDIVYVPSLKGDYIEDWIVRSVSYDQNDGNVSVSIQATREYGAGKPMDKKSADKFMTIAQSNNLIGPNSTLEAWDRYAWSLTGK